MRGLRLLMSAWGFTYYEVLLVTGSLAAIALASVMPVWGLTQNPPPTSDTLSNSPPSVTLVVLPSAPKTGERISLVGAASDVDKDPMTFDFWINEESVYRGGTSLLEWVFDSPGVYVVKFSARDDKGGSDTAAISLEVRGDGVSNKIDQAEASKSSSAEKTAGVNESSQSVLAPNKGEVKLVLESRSLTTGDPVPAGLTGGGPHVAGNVGVQVTSVLPGYAFAGWYNGKNKVSDSPSFTYALEQDTTLVAYLVKLSVELSADRLEVPENGSVDLLIRLSAPPLLPVRISLLEQAGGRSFLVSGAESAVVDAANWDSGVAVQVVAPGDSDASDGSARLVFGGEGVVSDEVVLVERDAHAWLEIEVVPKDAGLAFGGGLIPRDSLALVGVQPNPGFYLQQWQVVNGGAEIQENRGSDIRLKTTGSALVRAVLVGMEQ